MTYTATFLSLERATKVGSLVPLAPLDGAAQVRSLHVTPEIRDLLSGANPQSGLPTWLSDPLIGRFLVGQCVWVCLSKEPVRKVDVDLKRLVGAGEIWTLRFASVRKRINGWRIFGMFLHFNCFVGLRACARDALRTADDWMRTIEETKHDWTRVLTPDAPLSSDRLDAYLSEPYRDVTASY